MPLAATSTITVRVLLFASYAEALGLDSADLELERGTTIEKALEYLRGLPGGDCLPPKPLCAVNLAQAQTDTVLAEGDELAILPPLAGG